jgi:hypothetical protein
MLQSVIDTFLSGLKGLTDFVTGVLFEILKLVLYLLPKSPFRDLEEHFLPEGIMEIMAYANYYFPLDVIASIVGVWILAVGSYYGYGIILRFIKAIK